MKKNNCYSYTVLVDYYRCTAVVEDSCTGDLRVVYFDEYGFETNDISQGCGDQNLNEIILYVPDESGTNSNPADPIEPVDEPNDPNECDIFDFECNESSGGIADDYRSTLSLNMTALNTSQKNLLNQALSNLINDCLGYTLANSLFGSVNVVVDSTKKNAAEYNPIYNSITFRSNDDIGSTNLGHELFHMYQQQLYGILDDIFNDPGHVGGSNIEFEAVAIDMLYPMLLNNADTQLPPGVSVQAEELESSFEGAVDLHFWLDELLESHPNGNIGFLDNFETHNWFESLTIFKQSLPPPGNSSTDMYNYPINPHLHPEALVMLLDNYFKSNCI